MTMFDRVKEISKKRGLTLAQLNEKVGFKQNVIYSWKTKTPSVDKVKAVADVLNVSVDYLLGNTDNPDPSTSSNNLTKNQKLIAYSIDPDISDEERQAIINMVKEAMKFRRRLQVTGMTDLEKIEDMYPQLKFWGIEVNNPHYHGCIVGTDVYINTLQDDIDWLKTALHEASHYENDSGNLTNARLVEVLRAEGYADRQSIRSFNIMFG